MLMTEYETVLILHPDLSGTAIEDVLGKVRDVMTKTSAKLLHIEHWGKKRLAYEIEKQTRGVYVRTHFLGRGGCVAELERVLRMSEPVLRFLTIKLASRVDDVQRDAQTYEKPDYDAANSPAAQVEREDVAVEPAVASGSETAVEDKVTAEQAE